MSRTRAHTIIEHPSDIGLDAYGQTLIEAFEEAAYGMLSILAERAHVRPEMQKHVTITTEDAPQLLVKWLSELLYLYDGEKFIPSVIRITALTETGLEAVVSGELFDPGRHMPLLDIKAVTYHQLRIDRNRNEVRVYFDV